MAGKKSRKKRRAPHLDRSALRKTLHETFGFTRLRPGQQDVIDSVVAGRNTLAVMPTGSGKSLCYQLPALNMPGTTVVVSPLISLIKDQADKLREAGVSAVQVNSTLSTREEAETIDSIEKAENEFVFATPERLSDPDFITTLQANPVDLFVIDEAHCISRWGHDFRPAYLQLGIAIEALGRPTVLALTATATDEVIEDIRRQLGIPDLRVINTGIYRSNLHYQVTQVTSENEKLARALQFIHDEQGSGIVYAATVKATEELHSALLAVGENVVRYHGRLPAKERKANQDAFMEGKVRVMVATNAFGMGIDKPDIRFVIHQQIPGNLEAYYQESGRAGRDGKDARCILLFYTGDKRIQQFFLARRYPEAREVRAAYEALKALSADLPEITLEQVTRKAGDFPKNKLQVALKLLKDEGIASMSRGRLYRLARTDVDPDAIAGLADAYRERGERDRDALERMVFYAQTGFCRWKVLLEYFGEDADFERCGSCDNCLRPPERRLVPVTREDPVLRVPRKTPEPPPFRPGRRVRVPKFGEGQIAAVAGEKIDVVFPDSKTRTFLRDFVELI